MLEIAVDFCWP